MTTQIVSSGVVDWTAARTPASDFAKTVAAEAKGAGTPLKTLAVGRQDVFRINPYDLHVKEGWNSRVMDTPENQAHIAQLAASIAENGVQKPLSIYYENGKAFVSDGHCRLLATWTAIENGAQIKTVPCLTDPRGANEADRVLSQITANSGKPLAPIEMAAVVSRLLRFGWDEDQIAKRTGFSKQRITQFIELSEAEPAVVAMVKTGEVSATTAMSVVREVGAERATTVLKKAVREAKAEGRGKATGRHVKAAAASVGVSHKKTEGAAAVAKEKLTQLSTLLNGAHVTKDGRDVTVVLKTKEWARVCALLNLDDPPGQLVGQL